MSEFAEKYRRLSNLKVKQLLTQLPSLTPEAATALRREADERGLTAPPKRIKKTAVSPTRINFDKYKNWLQLKAHSGRQRKHSENLLDAPVYGPKRLGWDVMTKPVKGLFVSFLLLFVLSVYNTMAFMSSVDDSHYNPYEGYAFWMVMLLPFAIKVLVLYGLWNRGYRGLAGASFLAAFWMMGEIAYVIGAFTDGYLSYLQDDPVSEIFLGILLPVVFYISIMWFATQPAVARFYEVGPRFSQSYIIIGICLGLLYEVAQILYLFYYLNYLS